jgi:hypothetical protein
MEKRCQYELLRFQVGAYVCEASLGINPRSASSIGTTIYLIFNVANHMSIFLKKELTIVGWVL